MTVRSLGPEETISRRPFTSPRLYERDRAILAYMVEDLRGLLGEVAEGTVTVDAHSPLEWSVHGLRRRTIVCDPDTLLAGRKDLCVVGFFGLRYPGKDAMALEEANADLVLEFRNYPGILSYSSMELADGNWANLVIHDLPRAREYWRASQRHADAASRLSPLFYQTVRIHNGILPRGINAGRSIVIQRTKYWDFRRAKVWQAVRELIVEGRLDDFPVVTMHSAGSAS